MNTNQLKKFAREARTKLLEQVGAKLSFVINADTAELREKAGALKQLREELGRTRKEQLIEKVAYTWFNRLMALRFMDANDYQPLGIRIITPKDGYSIPEILDEAKRGNIPEELHLNRQKVHDLLDNRLRSSNPQNEAFKELLIAACNHLHSTFPFLFEKINDYTELLMPDDLTSDFSIVTMVRNGMPADDCRNVEIIGWLYQFYISEKKDEVFASKEKVKKEDIPAATQLFTPRWIVEYMVQNTAGKLWLQNNPKSRLREHMPYFIESASLTADDYLKINSPEEIRLLDPASGSGHILVYGFDLFTKIYEEQGYNTNDIPKLIIEKNLYGFEIDERAAQLSALALMMKAREYQRRAFRKDITPNVVCFQDLSLPTDEIKETLLSLNIWLSDELMHDMLQMQQATNFGSLIIPHSHSTEIQQVGEMLKQLLINADVFQRNKIDEFIKAVEQIQKLAEKYHCVVTNPPYMGGGNMNTELSEFVKINFPESKTDLMACFIESGLEVLYNKGFIGMINQQSWMFLSSYEQLRNKLINSIHFDSLLHLGAKTFPEIGGEIVQNASFTFFKELLNYEGIFIRLVDFNNSEEKRIKTINALENSKCGYFFQFNQKDFIKIPSKPIAYWINNHIVNLFSKKKKYKEVIFADGQNKTGNNDKYLRCLWEIDSSKIGVNNKFIFYAKGGNFRKWQGNLDYVVMWDEESRKHYRKDKIARIIKKEYWFREGFTFSRMSEKSNIRILDVRGTFDATTVSFFISDNYTVEYFNVLGFFNSKVGDYFIKILNPTLVFQLVDIRNTPYISGTVETSKIAKTCAKISIYDWNSHENSWDFKTNPLIKLNYNNLVELELCYDHYKQYCRLKFIKLHQMEEEINQHFIHIYELKIEINKIVPLEDITILQDELDRKALSKLNKKLVRDPETHEVLNYDEIELPFIPKEIMAQFISYSVGCMFGRYSLDKESLILANQGETLQDYLDKIGKSSQECSFLPDADNIIPILDNEWFEDDIVGRFHHFLKVTFGEKNFNRNLAFIEEQIGKDIRKYFLRDFYTDHIQRYKKRPIYWMFSSPNGSFNVLIYLHRYTPDTISNILNKYLKEFIGKLKTRREHLQEVQVSGSPAEKTKAIKETANIDKMLTELQVYERDILFPLATERIAIDLDDGVLVNYNKFGNAVKEVAGLNDKKSKDKVRKFDWIDTTQIR